MEKLLLIMWEGTLVSYFKVNGDHEKA